MFSKPTQDQTIALAGIFQACHLVDQLATTGKVDARQLDTAISSLLNQNPRDVVSIFNGTHNLNTGFELMESSLALEISAPASNTLRYAISVLYLQRRLSNDKVMLDKIGTGIARAAQQAETYSPTHDNVLSNLADVYQQTLSTYRFRIQVKGEPSYLQQESIAVRIRCLLFAAIRSAVLFQQLGGRRWHMIFYRKAFLEHLRRLK